MTFDANIFILPGLGNSLDGHWQTIWEQEHGFQRIQQRQWDTPVMEEWIGVVQQTIIRYDPATVVLVGHSLACSTIAYWAKVYNQKIRGALLVAPSDTESEVYPPGTTGFAPMPLNRLPFPSITVTSANDIYVSERRAKAFAEAWGSRLIILQNAGHINVASGYGHWPAGLELLRTL